jgi:1L-myo-inositol 1-phosphate cytidylyltransferase / CDP-L-myo-inositol myo-inositolphosphotransferase
VLADAPGGARRVLAAGSLLAHRDAMKSLAYGDEATATLDASAAAPEGPYTFAPVDVTDRASAARAESALFRSLRKPQDGWTSRWLNRYISLAISRFLVKTPLRPNQVSFGILLVGLLGAYLATRGTYEAMLAGAFLFQAQSVLDGCDGEMSRITYRGSHLGEWLDTIGDDLTNYGFFTGAALGLYRQTGSPVYLGAGGVVLFCGVAVSAIEYRYLLKIGSGDLVKYPTSQTASGSGAFALIAPLFKRDTFVFITLLAAALGQLGPMLVVFALGAIGIFANVLAAEAKMARERRAEAARGGGLTERS